MQTITLPKRFVEQMIKVSVQFETLHDELEDFLIVRQPHLIKKLRRARQEHLSGKTHPFSGLR